MIPRTILDRVCRRPLAGLQPAQAFDACRRLGRLARWWLRPEVLRLAGDHDPAFPELTSPEPPALSGKLGSCWVVFVRMDPALSLLREAFLLPLRWRQDEAHAPGLPLELRSLAETVVEQMGAGGLWGLWPGEELDLDRADSSGAMGLACASGWASLSAGLILARKNLRPRSEVWASGVWKADGLAEADELPAKLELARDWGVSRFFVPVWQMSQARQNLATHGIVGIEVDGLEATAARKPSEALRTYLSHLSGEPAPPDPADQSGKQFNVCKEYHKLFTRQAGRAFYRSHLLPTIVQRCRQHLRLDWQPTHLVTVASDSSELILLAGRMLQPQKMLVLHTPEYKQETTQTASELALAEETGAIVLIPGQFPYEGDMERDGRAMLGHIQPFLAGVAQDRVVFDLTPGTKLMLLTLERLARRHFPGSWLLYLKHRTPDGRPEPGTEFPLLWRAGE